MWNDARTLTLAANLLLVAALLMGVGAGVAWLTRQPLFTLSAIEVHAMDAASLRYVSAASVRTALAGQLQGNFFTLDLAQARAVFERVPWVRRASVRRVWPNRLRVALEEEQPLAYWNAEQLLNIWGEPFTANLGELEDDASMPRFIGPPGSAPLVQRRHAQLARALAPLALRIERLELSARHAWQAALSNGMTLELGRDPQAEALVDPLAEIPVADSAEFTARIERFARAWPEVHIALAGRAVTYADLRYPHGFALGLVQASPPPARSQAAPNRDSTRGSTRSSSPNSPRR